MQNINDIFKNALNGQDAVDAPDYIFTVLRDPDDDHILKLEDFADTFGDFLIDYSIAQTQDSFDSDESYYIDNDTQLLDLRHKVFEFMEEAAGLLNCTITDMCAAVGYEHHKLFTDYLFPERQADDDALLYVAQQIHEEVLAHQAHLIEGQKMHYTRISSYLEKKPIAEYVENTKDSIPLSVISIDRA